MQQTQSYARTVDLWTPKEDEDTASLVPGFSVGGGVGELRPVTSQASSFPMSLVLLFAPSQPEGCVRGLIEGLCELCALGVASLNPFLPAGFRLLNLWGPDLSFWSLLSTSMLLFPLLPQCSSTPVHASLRVLHGVCALT